MSAIVVSPLLTDIYTQVTTLMNSWLPSTCELDQGLDNRVPQPLTQADGSITDYVIMTATYSDRLRTDIGTWGADQQILAPLTINQARLVILQMDFYGPNSLDLATIFTSLWRNQYACSMLAPVCQPLYADDAKLMPLTNEEQQYEARWMVEAAMDYQPTLSVQQQFAIAATPKLVNVDVTFPP